MKNWKAIIIDDEPPAIREMAYLLEAFPQISIVGEAQTIDQSMALLIEKKPDLLFLDIDLGKHNGFDLLPHIPPDTQIVFVTAYDSYAIRAFEVNALDYLMKPVHPDSLKNCIKRLGNPFQEEKTTALDANDQILIGIRNGSRFVRVNSISCIQAYGDYTRLYSVDGYCGVVHHTMKKWNARLPDKMFLRIHRSYIVNTTHVIEIRKEGPESYQTILPNPQEPIPVSRRYSRVLMQRYNPQRTG